MIMKKIIVKYFRDKRGWGKETVFLLSETALKIDEPVLSIPMYTPCDFIVRWVSAWKGWIFRITPIRITPMEKWLCL